MPHSSENHLHWDYRDGRVAAVVAAVVYSLWVVEVVLPLGGTAEGALAHQDSAFAKFLESAHRIAAILVMLAAGLGLALGAREKTGHLLAASWWAMGLFGLASLVATVFPGPCVVSTDVTCTTESMVEALPGATTAQTVIAVIALLAALVSVIILTIDRFRAKDRAWWLVAALALLQLASAVSILVMAVWVYTTSGDGQPGVEFSALQRIHLGTVALWLLATGLLPELWKRSRPVPRRTRSAH